MEGGGVAEVVWVCLCVCINVRVCAWKEMQDASSDLAPRGHTHTRRRVGKGAVAVAG